MPLSIAKFLMTTNGCPMKKTLPKEGVASTQFEGSVGLDLKSSLPCFPGFGTSHRIDAGQLSEFPPGPKVCLETQNFSGSGGQNCL